MVGAYSERRDDCHEKMGEAFVGEQPAKVRKNGVDGASEEADPVPWQVRRDT